MKTTSHNGEKEIRFGIWFVVLAMAIFATIRVKELQLKEMNNGTETIYNRLLVNHTKFSSNPANDARLVEEPLAEIESLMKSNQYNAVKFAEAEMALENERFFKGITEAAETEPWMTIAGYKATDFANAEMALETERFLKGNTETTEVQPWMTSAEYKATDFANAEMALETERFFNSNNETTEVQPWMTSAEYKATDFANAEMALESERFFKGITEAAETEPWMTIAEYKATNFANAEMALEIAGWMNRESNPINNNITNGKTNATERESTLAIE